MKLLNKALVSLLLGSVMTMSAQAAMNYAGQPYVGAKVGKFLVDEDGADSVEDPMAFGVYAGYNFDTNFGAEIEYIGSNDADVKIDGDSGEYDYKTYGAYATYRYAFPNTLVYAKGKLGIAKSEINLNIGNFSASSSDTGLAGGVGIGYNLNSNIGVEAEYAFTDSDVDALTIGANLKF